MIHDSNTLLWHYTKSADVIARILKNGFAMIPNRRNLAHILLGRDIFARREPQQFGMVSFTELDRYAARYHRDSFGTFGIAVSWEWARRHETQRVLYLDDGPVMNTFAWLFRFAAQELERACPEAVTPVHLSNKNVALMYSQIYSKLLTLYEYMEPARNAGQVEWRTVNKLPYHHDLSDWKKMVDSILRFADKGIGTLPVSPADIEMIVCPASEVSAVRRAIPSEFRSVPIVPISIADSVRGRLRSLFGYVEAHVRRTKRVPTAQLPPRPTRNDEPQSTRSESGGIFDVPAISKFMGMAAYPDDLYEAAYCDYQCETKTGHTLSIKMPLDDHFTLMNYMIMAVQENATMKRHYLEFTRRAALEQKSSAARGPNQAGGTK